MCVCEEGCAPALIVVCNMVACAVVDVLMSCMTCPILCNRASLPSSFSLQVRQLEAQLELLRQKYEPGTTA